MARSRGALLRAILCMVALCGLLPVGVARAQLSGLTHLPVSNTAPVTFSADSVEYDREKQLVIAKGSVEAWQNGVVLRADEVTFNRATGEVTAHGHIVLMQPDGEVLFADYAELSQNFKEGVFEDPRALLPGNGRMAGNGARRTEGLIDTMSKGVYSTCNLCKGNPTKAPLWQMRARLITDDEEHQRIEYTDAEMQMFGIPVAWFPFFSTPSPNAKRSSGLLIPSVGINSHLGGFFAQPYYWVINDQSDATITPFLTTRAGPDLELQYRLRFNQGYLNLRSSIAYSDHQGEGLVDLNGVYDINDTWRGGFTLQRASSATYVTNFRLNSLLSGDPSVLPSNLFLEGFGEGAYARLDTRFYQSVNTAVSQSLLPNVLPRFEYSYFGQPDALGGRLSLETQDFQVLRQNGTDTRRASLSADWTRPYTGPLGDLWSLDLHTDIAAYDATQFNLEPNFGTHGSVNDAKAWPAAAVNFRWPFQRDSSGWGTQIIEPMAQVVVSPTEGGGQLSRYPNEDSLDLFNFSDADLFSLHRLGGIDRLEGGNRLAVAMHGAWYLGGMAFDSLIGQSYRTTRDTWLPEQTGLRDQVSDIVGRATFTPASWLDVTYRTRLSHQTLRSNYSEIVAAAGVPRFNLSVGYIYSPYDPYYYFDQAPPPPTTSGFYTPRHEITVGASTKWGYYRLTGFARRDIATGQMVAAGGDAIYEDECFIADLRFYRRFTNYNGDNGATTLLVQFTFKTVGQFGFSAL
ncbi:MAG TPA: LPS assembly protein LptD [Acetobacteraceae bacterium]|nr:LPS assembly protein LptD [Acetobacteraceae bacterium]